MSLEIIQGIHRRVMKGFTYVTDEKQYGVIEKWVQPGDPYNVTGDCEDFALACRQLLRENNLPSRLVYCEDETGAGHLVLESSGHILDNRQRTVVSMQKLHAVGYKFIRISGFEPGDDWRKL
jgi:predicted transglutaminase-like cysteine proteinase